MHPERSRAQPDGEPPQSFHMERRYFKWATDLLGWFCRMLQGAGEDCIWRGSIPVRGHEARGFIRCRSGFQVNQP